MGFTHIGKIVKHKGLKGACIIKLNPNFSIDFKKIKSLLIEIENSKVPFIIDHYIPLKSNHFEFKFIDLNSREDTNHILKKEIFIKSKLINKIINDLSKIIGYNILHENKKIGTVTNYYKKSQPILFCDINNKETLIPYTKEIVQNINNLKKEIHIIIPQGLLDLN